MINSFKYNLGKSIQKILYRTGNRVNEKSGWIIEIVPAEYVSISVYSPLSGSTCIKLSCVLKYSMKVLINIKNNDNKCFLWCHIRRLNPLEMYPERISKADKEMSNDLDYEGIDLLVSSNDFNKIEKKNNICITVLCYENELTYPVYLSAQKFKNCMDLLMISDGNKSRYVYVKDFNKFMCNNTTCKNEKYFCRYCLQCFRSERVWVEHKETCLKANGK